MADFDVGLASVFGIGDAASPEVFTALAKVISMSPPSKSKADIEVTNLQSSGGYREYISGLKESGECNVKIRATAANITAIETEFAKSAETNYRITSNTLLNTVWTFAARLMDITYSEIVADATLEVDLRFKLTGQDTISAIA